MAGREWSTPRTFSFGVSFPTKGIPNRAGAAYIRRCGRAWYARGVLIGVVCGFVGELVFDILHAQEDPTPSHMRVSSCTNRPSLAKNGQGCQFLAP
jgi:hypothetical protein